MMGLTILLRKIIKMDDIVYLDYLPMISDRILINEHMDQISTRIKEITENKITQSGERLFESSLIDEMINYEPHSYINDLSMYRSYYEDKLFKAVLKTLFKPDHQAQNRLTNEK
jgi:hypothetical protein